MGFPQIGLQEALVFDVRAYGAVGDGVHDDTAAIQEAINAANADGGGIVWIPTGTYLVTATTTPGQSSGIGAALYGLSSVIIMGAGVGATTIKVQTGSATGRSDAIAYGFDASGTTVSINNVGARSLTIDLSAITATYGSGIRCANPSAIGHDADFIDLQILSAQDWGVSWGGFTTNFQRMRARHIVVNGSVYGGIWISLTDYPKVLDLYVENVTGHSTSGEGCILEVESGNYGEFTDIRGSSLPIQAVLLSGDLIASFRGISGTTASGAHGVEIAGASNIDISSINLVALGGGGNGIEFGSGAAQDIKITKVFLNGYTNFVNTQSATSVADFKLSDFTLTGAGDGLVIGASGSPITEMNISDGFCNGNGYWLVANNVAGTIENVFPSGSTSVSSCPNLAIRNCPGYNPVGSSVPGTAFALPASGTAWTNNTGVDGTLWVTGAGTVTDVVLQGVTVGSSLSVGQSYFVPAGGTITFTYSVAPTLVFVGN